LNVCFAPKIGIGGAFRLRPSDTTVRTGPYTAVREVTLTRFDQGRKTERFEVGIGESDGEGFWLRLSAAECLTSLADDMT
jgi:hypothetical protein